MSILLIKIMRNLTNLCSGQRVVTEGTRLMLLKHKRGMNNDKTQFRHS